MCGPECVTRVAPTTLTTHLWKYFVIYRTRMHYTKIGYCELCCCCVMCIVLKRKKLAKHWTMNEGESATAVVVVVKATAVDECAFLTRLFCTMEHSLSLQIAGERQIINSKHTWLLQIFQLCQNFVRSNQYTRLHDKLFLIMRSKRVDVDNHVWVRLRPYGFLLYYRCNLLCTGQYLCRKSDLGHSNRR